MHLTSNIWHLSYVWTHLIKSPHIFLFVFSPRWLHWWQTHWVSASGHKWKLRKQEGPQKQMACCYCPFACTITITNTNMNTIRDMNPSTRYIRRATLIGLLLLLWGPEHKEPANTNTNTNTNRDTDILQGFNATRQLVRTLSRRGPWGCGAWQAVAN